MSAAEWQDGGVSHGAAVEEHHVGGAAADVDERDAEVFLFGREGSVGSGKRLENDVRDGETRLLAALEDVLQGGGLHRDDVDLGFRTSRSAGSATARAASSTRSTSLAETSPFRTATTPWLVTPRTWAPEMLATTWRTSQPAMASASATAFRMAATVDSRWTITPLRNPRDGAVPRPTTSMPRSPTLPTITVVFDVPRSRPAINVRFATPIPIPTPDGYVRTFFVPARSLPPPCRNRTTTCESSVRSTARS
jgi:hypothetical protein